MTVTELRQRHSILVRVTHWINTFAFLAFVISGIAVLLAHPRLYWGETGGFGSPALIELPLPLNTDQSGWGRSLHFLAAWVCVLNGAFYVASGFTSRHFKTSLLPGAKRLADNGAMSYNNLQRCAYLMVIFFLFPLMIVTGLAMSPAVTSSLPIIVNSFGGYQSSRTIHFFVADLLVLFLVVHVVKVYLGGFRIRMRGMISGRIAGKVASL